MASHKRTELLPTVIFDKALTLDSHPISVANGRLIPGPLYSHEEYDELQKLVEDEDERTEKLLPTTKQFARIAVNESWGCWEVEPTGGILYGRMNIGGVSALAHRSMYIVFYGVDSIPSDYRVDHLCDNKPCCYPRHLEPVTQHNNILRGNASRRRAGNGQIGFDFS